METVIGHLALRNGEMEDVTKICLEEPVGELARITNAMKKLEISMGKALTSGRLASITKLASLGQGGVGEYQPSR
jgi:hypothetical protein